MNFDALEDSKMSCTGLNRYSINEEIKNFQRFFSVSINAVISLMIICSVLINFYFNLLKVFCNSPIILTIFQKLKLIRSLNEVRENKIL